jgi:hypothetical protein
MTGSSQWMQERPERCGHHIYISHPAIHTWQGNIKTQHPDVKQNIVDHEFQTVNVVTLVKKMFNMQSLVAILHVHGPAILTFNQT